MRRTVVTTGTTSRYQGGRRRLDVSGRDLKLYIEGHLSAHPRVTTMSALAREARIRRDTLYAWFTETSTPRTYEFGRVAEVLGVSLGELWAAYGGSVTPQAPEEERLARLVQEAYERGFAAGFRVGRETRDAGS
jgi:lambda repressor-like predicted transcriptional regulator